MSLSKHNSDQQLSCPVMTRALDRSAAIIELLSKRREDEQLKERYRSVKGGRRVCKSAWMSCKRTTAKPRSYT
ncbi:unnamed protein product [Pleuronectes platessa]|uniref:Uncharacterized protein n=1 Tax=Pleuronectes platessa TaxID=8262 RepID=A0A9N7U924_PLEPL|nr:unnamed protein product [Pleuronectes platessa]